jgi:hypothetical protein
LFVKAHSEGENGEQSKQRNAHKAGYPGEKRCLALADRIGQKKGGVSRGVGAADEI